MTNSVEIPFVGGSYQGRSADANSQACVNMFPKVDKQGGITSLRGTPGTTEYTWSIPGIESWYICADGGDFTSIDAAMASNDVGHGDTLIVCAEACSVAAFTMSKWVHITVEDTDKDIQTKITQETTELGGAITLAFTEDCPDIIYNQTIYIEGFYVLGLDSPSGEDRGFFDGGDLSNISGKVVVNRCWYNGADDNHNPFSGPSAITDVSATGPDVEFRNCDICSRGKQYEYTFEDCDLSKITMTKCTIQDVVYTNGCTNSLAADDYLYVNGPQSWGSPDSVWTDKHISGNDQLTNNSTVTRTEDREGTKTICHYWKMTASGSPSWYRIETTPIRIFTSAATPTNQRCLAAWVWIPSGYTFNFVRLLQFQWNDFGGGTLVDMWEVYADTDLTDQWQWVISDPFPTVDSTSSDYFYWYLSTEGTDISGAEFRLALPCYAAPDYGVHYGTWEKAA